MCTAGKSAKERRGTVAVEVAVIALPLLLLIFWILEFGRLVMVEQVLTNAAREGARRAVLEHMTASQVRTQVLQYLGQTSVPGANVDVQPADVPFHLLGFGDPITVTVSVPYAQASLFPLPAGLQGSTLSSTAVMRAERPE